MKNILKQLCQRNECGKNVENIYEKIEGLKL